MTVKGLIARILRRVMGRMALGDVYVSGAPETYWIARKKDVIGMATLEKLRKTRQIDTYHAIFEALAARSVRQVADLGCNIAALGQLLYDWGWSGQYIAIDTNEFALREAKKALAAQGHECRLLKGNIRDLAFEDRSLECVVMKDVLEHMEDFRPLLAEALRVSARLAIVANFIPWTEGKTLIRREPQGFYHNLYSRREVYSFVREHGFSVDDVLPALEKDSRANEVIVFARLER